MEINIDQDQQPVTHIQPQSILLKDGETTATMYPIPANPEQLPAGLLAFLLDEFNMEIDKGDSLPYYEPLAVEGFCETWFHAEGLVCIMVLGEIPELDYSDSSTTGGAGSSSDDPQAEVTRHTGQYLRRKERRNLNLNIQWEKQCLGAFNLRPAYPGRSSHVVTASFLVNAGIRGKGIGRTLVECFLNWAPQLGFTSSVFPLVYGTNVGIRRILETLNFRRVGKLPESAILKGCDVPIDSFIYAKEFTHVSKSIDILNEPNKHFAKYERLRYYLETGKYPEYCDRTEKARLRASAKYHIVQNGKLMRQGREVVYDPEKQLEVAFEVHQVAHQGINKVTTTIAERYHWKGIKTTVARIVAACPLCKNQHQDDLGIVVEAGSPQQQAHMITRDNVDVDHSSQLSKMAAAVIGNLQGPSPDLERTPVDETPQTKKAKPSIHRMKFNGAQDPHIASQEILGTEQSMNNFSIYARQQQRTKRRYLDVAMSGNMARNSSVSISDLSSGPATVEIEEHDDTNMVDDALLNLEDNVMAAVEAAQDNKIKDDRYGHNADVQPFY
ncbi:LANO_0G05446g1_1 [Lachancea nothofagi CBS 11611]|uniref:LANO_0G05446g1_1 n=1 Tax=Lachancea nothofagi CBS 11611 TaxID=1266666 RepID=A0A1G4KGM5_9SACH|nr:LANO_0G05446g1_1 [Lachancea nothofagi CBS 11611]